MHNWSNRANTVVCYGGFVLMVCLVLTTITSYIMYETHYTSKVGPVKIDKFGRVRESEQALLTFDLKADLSKLFHWHTKQLFCYVTVEYVSTKNVVNQVVVWDQIIQTKENATLNLRGAFSEYVLIDQGYYLKGNEVNLTFSYNIVPISGLLTRHTVASYPFKIPTEYVV
eukprot:TRINITY_DN1354_c0_g2_i1.p1 TRINITY_DN1354_c0_g2~~TRINITY_DN1354_c0_g2_i1.p1  ORF type:complete len:170 (-),score=14.34 TRINITY_DN1354_c0_g2_i1:360-869(-)